MSQRPENTVIKVKPMNLLRSYQGWPSLLQVPDVPPRSRLYGLVPRETGTLWTESLAGYLLVTLAWGHHTPLGQFHPEPGLTSRRRSPA